MKMDCPEFFRADATKEFRAEIFYVIGKCQKKYTKSNDTELNERFFVKI